MFNQLTLDIHTCPLCIIAGLSDDDFIKIMNRLHLKGIEHRRGCKNRKVHTLYEIGKRARKILE